MEDFIEMNESVLGEYVDLSVDCPSHDTLERIVSMVNPDFLKELKLFLVSRVMCRLFHR